MAGRYRPSSRSAAVAKPLRPTRSRARCFDTMCARSRMETLPGPGAGRDAASAHHPSLALSSRHQERTTSNRGSMHAPLDRRGLGANPGRRCSDHRTHSSSLGATGTCTHGLHARHPGSREQLAQTRRQVEAESGRDRAELRLAGGVDKTGDQRFGRHSGERARGHRLTKLFPSPPAPVASYAGNRPQGRSIPRCLPWVTVENRTLLRADLWSETPGVVALLTVPEPVDLCGEGTGPCRPFITGAVPVLVAPRGGGLQSCAHLSPTRSREEAPMR
jgi:hypothetical protein